MTKKQIYIRAAELIDSEACYGCCAAIINRRYLDSYLQCKSRIICVNNFAKLFKPRLSSPRVYWMDCPDLYLRNSAQQINMRVLALLFMAEMEKK